MSGISKRVSGSWVSGDYGIMKTATDTITTLPADLYPNDTTATVGLKGNMEQNDTPTPTNPIQPSECGDRTANLYNIDAKNTDNGYINGTQLNKDGTTESWSACEVTEYIELQPSTTYILSRLGSYIAIAYCIYDANKQYISGENYSGQILKTIAMPSNGKYLRFSHHKAKINTMLNEGSTVLPYQPYGYKLDIKSANTTTPVYLGEVQTTRKIGKYAFTGNENWYDVPNNGVYYTNVVKDLANKNNYTPRCSHFKLIQQTAIAHLTDGSFTSDNNVFFWFKESSITSLADWKAWLAQQYANGTPVCVWYVLATETTGIVNEPIRKIGSYVDTVSGISIPTITGKDMVDVETSLKPSEVSLSYTGWHNATVKEWDGSQWNE